MKRSIRHLPQEKQDELKEIIAFVVEHLPVGMVVLFGSYARGDWVEDKYIEYGTTYEYKSDFDLLFVVDSEEEAVRKKIASKLKRRILKNVESDTPVNVIYHGIDYLNNEIEEGNYFFADILREGIVIFNSKKFKLARPKEISSDLRVSKAENYYRRWFKSAQMFFLDYETNFIRGNDDSDYYKKAVFELHQAAESLYMTVLLVFSDYKPKVHDLEELHVRACKHNPRIKTVFPRENPEQERLFTLLKKAYIDSRYKMGYEVSKEDLENLSHQVKLLEQLTKKICSKMIAELRKL